MGRLPLRRPNIDSRGAAILARWLVFAVCAIWLVGSVPWSLGGSGPSANPAAALAGLATFGPPVLCLLMAAALLNPGSGVGSGLSPEDATAIARLQEVVGVIDLRISASIERAEAVLGVLDASGSRADLAATNARDTLASLTELLRNIDDLSKETTSAVAKRAYALDGALDGVLERARQVFADIDHTLRARAGEVTAGLDGTLSGMIGDVSRQIDLLAERAADARAGVAASHNRSSDDGAIVGSATVHPLADATEATRRLLRLLAPPLAATASDARSSALRGLAIAEVAGCGATEAWSGEFIQEFETLIGRALVADGGDTLAATLLNSEFGQLYQHLARRAGRLTS